MSTCTPRIDSCLAKAIPFARTWPASIPARARTAAACVARSRPGLLSAMGAQGHAGAAGQDAADAERELREALLQWLFWLLAVIAYGCVGFAIVALLPPGSLGDAVPAGDRGWAGGFALAGLVAALGAQLWTVVVAIAMARGRAEHDADGGD